jgi:lipoate-protein ligase A
VSPAGGPWPLARVGGSVASLLGPWPGPAAGTGRAARLCAVEGTGAVVLGSAQDDAMVDRPRAADLGLALTRRRAGGGAVVVEPGAQVWLEVWLPRDDPLWIDDVVRSSWWLGDVWSDALTSVGVRDVSVHRGRAVRAPWSDVICFAGMGPGEVTAEGRKLVGLAQHRSRRGARFHTMAPLRWQPERLTAVLTARPDVPAPRADDLAHVAVGLRDVLGEDHTLGADAEATRVIDAVEHALARALA